MEFSWKGKIVLLRGVADSDWIYSLIKKTGTFYEIDLLKYIHYAIGVERGCILDVGANIGNHAVFFGLFISDAVVCFEPNPKVFPILVENLSSNKINYKAFQLGLGDKESEAEIELPTSQENNIGAARLVVNRGGNSIRVATLDSLLPEIKAFMNGKKISAIKIDVEGMESHVLRGGKRTLEEYRPDLFVEIMNSDQMQKIEAEVVPMGYQRIVSWAATPVWHFVHREKFRLMRQIQLATYNAYHKKYIVFAKLAYSRIKSIVS